MTRYAIFLNGVEIDRRASRIAAERRALSLRRDLGGEWWLARDGSRRWYRIGGNDPLPCLQF